jgi:2'-5' RNA ligase
MLKYLIEKFFMKSTLIKTLPGYKYNEYLLVLKPNMGLQEKIVETKKEFSKKYKIPGAIYSRPHITLANFIQFEMIEERLLNRLNTLAMGRHPFTVRLKDYGSFPTHTVYINVESKQQVENLVKALRPASQLMTLNKDNKPHFINDPHLTIARKLLPWQYEQSWNEYSHKHFTGSFIAENMLLLKKRTGEKYYQAAQQSEFLNLPVNVEQGKLFM